MRSGTRSGNDGDRRLVVASSLERVAHRAEEFELFAGMRWWEVPAHRQSGIARPRVEPRLVAGIDRRSCRGRGLRRLRSGGIGRQNCRRKHEKRDGGNREKSHATSVDRISLRDKEPVLGGRGAGPGGPGLWPEAVSRSVV